MLRKSVLNIHWKDWCWSWNSGTWAIWWEELTHWKRPWCCERLKVGGEGDHRGWDGWRASLTWWTWVCVGSGSWWWTRKPGMLGVHGVTKSQTPLRDWTELIYLHRRVHLLFRHYSLFFKFICALAKQEQQKQIKVFSSDQN